MSAVVPVVVHDAAEGESAFETVEKIAEVVFFAGGCAVAFFVGPFEVAPGVVADFTYQIAVAVCQGYCAA